MSDNPSDAAMERAFQSLRIGAVAVFHNRCGRRTTETQCQCQHCAGFTIRKEDRG